MIKATPRGCALQEAARKRNLLLALLFLIVTLICYGPTVSFPFYLDDFPGIVQNPWFFSPNPFIVILKNAATRVIGFATFLVQLQWFGATPEPFRLVNILIHAVNGILVYTFIRTLLERNQAMNSRQGHLIAAFCGFLFLLHPLQSQPVVYIHQRFTLLTALFALVALVSVASPRSSRSKFDVTSFCLVAAMLTKQNAFVLPFCFALLSWFMDKDKTPRATLLREQLKRWGWSLLIIPILMLVFRDKELADIGAIATDKKLSPLQYFAAQGPIIWEYLRLFIVPINQSLLRAPTPQFTTTTYLVSLLAYGALGAVLTIAWHFRSRFRLATFGCFFYLITISVESSFIPLEDLSFEHRTYLPNVGLLFIIADVLRYILQRYPHLMKRFGIFALAILGATSLLLIERLSVWRDPVALWQDNHEKFPNNEKASLNLGIALENTTSFQEAATVYRDVLAINPTSIPAQLSLASVLTKQNEWRAAVTLLQSLTITTEKDRAFYRFLSGQTQLAANNNKAAAEQLIPLVGPMRFYLTEAQHRLALRLTIVALAYDGQKQAADDLLTHYHNLTNDMIWPTLLRLFDHNDESEVTAIEGLPNEFLLWHALTAHERKDEIALTQVLATLPQDLTEFPELDLWLACYHHNSVRAEQLLNPIPPLRSTLKAQLTASYLLGFKQKLYRLQNFCRQNLDPLHLDPIGLTLYPPI